MQPLQVISLGHPLSRPSHKFIKGIAPKGWYSFYYASLHLDRFDQVLEATDSALDELRSQGADLSGATRTIIVPPGMSMVSMVFCAAWMGVTGDLPEILNVMRVGAEHVPCPELPVINLHSVKNNVRSKHRRKSVVSLVIDEGVTVE